jgi:hypothetical protein
VEPKAVDRLILLTLEHWDVPLQQLLQALYEIMRSALQKTLDETTHTWNTTALPRAIKQISQDMYLTAHLRDLRENVAQRALILEQRKPLTEDTRTMKRYEEEELQFLQAARLNARIEAYFNQQDRSIGKETSPEERARKLRNDTDAIKAKIGPDPFDREIKVMAKVRAYYQIASVRFVDHMRQSIEAEFFVNFRDGLHIELAKGLRVTEPDCELSSNPVMSKSMLTGLLLLGHEHCSKLLEEDEARGERRAFLRNKKMKVEEARLRLEELLNNPLLFDQQAMEV